mmetsp:Transcript_137912/g.428569  ORF Transcript_137912/g.428569 Transcript_137912/m.428569 type:complete len:288 (+) Transcript_137912:491-1354(+)
MLEAGVGHELHGLAKRPPHMAHRLGQEVARVALGDRLGGVLLRLRVPDGDDVPHAPHVLVGLLQELGHRVALVRGSRLEGQVRGTRAAMVLVGVVDGDRQLLEEPCKVQTRKVLLRGLEDPRPGGGSHDGNVGQATCHGEQSLNMRRMALECFETGEVLGELASPADPRMAPAWAIAAGDRRHAVLGRADLNGVHDEARGQKRVVPVKDDVRRLPNLRHGQRRLRLTLEVALHHAQQRGEHPHLLRERPGVHVAFVLAGGGRAALGVGRAAHAHGRRGVRAALGARL